MDKNGTSFSDWDPKGYLRDYYAVSEIPQDGLAVYAFLSKYFASADKRFTTAIDVGSGPTIHHAMGFLPYVEEVHLADYVPANLDEVALWLKDSPGQHDWDVFIQGFLNLTPGGATDVGAMKRELRRKITTLIHADLSKQPPFEPAKTYSLVTSFFCACSATGSISEWRRMMRNLLGLVEPGGTLLIAALRNSTGYASGDQFFPSPNVNEAEFERLFAEPALRVVKHSVEVAESGWGDHGWPTMVLASAEVST